MELEQKRNPLLQFVREYVNNGVNEQLFTRGAEILRELFDVKQNELNSFGSMTSLLRNLLENVPSISTPGRKYSIIDLMLEVDDKTNFATALQMSLNKFAESTTIKNINDHMIIDVELWTETQKQNVYLFQLPERVFIRREELNLVGAVRHSPGHFTGLCRSLDDGTWKEVNDMKSEVITNQLPEVSLNVLVFI